MNVLITGAAGGIGKACVKHLAKDKSLKIITVSRSEGVLSDLKKEILNDYDVDIDVFVSDFTKQGFHLELASYIEMNYGQLTYLINNAGLLINKSFEEVTINDLNAQLHINYVAPFQLMQSLIPLLKKSTSQSHVVNISSMGGYQGSSKFPGLSAYSSSKAALSSLTECLAEEYKDSNINFNCLALGSANTEMLRAAFPSYVSEVSPEKIAEFIVEFTLNDHKYFNGKVLPVAGIDK